MSLYASSNRAFVPACTQNTNVCGDSLRILYEYWMASCDLLLSLQNRETRRADVNIPYAAKTDKRGASSRSSALVVYPR